jgi:hypothetical protein
MMEGEGEAIGRKCIELALAGDLTAIKLVLDRVAPARKGRPIPTIDVKKGEGSVEALLRAVLEGVISPDEGKSIVDMIESAARTAADSALADMREKQLELMRQTAADSATQSVLLVPMPATPEEWERFALHTQRALKASAKE